MTQAELLRYLVEILDEPYITEWAARLGLTALWAQVRKQAE